MGRAAHLELRETHFLTAYGRPSKGWLMHRIAALLTALAVLTCASPAAAAVRSDSTLQDKLAKALRVPHVSAASSAAVAVDLATGEQLFAANDALPLAPASNE